MNISLRICGRVLGGLAVASGVVATAHAQDADVVGNWDCSVTMTDANLGMTLNADFDMAYAADGTYTRAGEMTLVVTALQVDTSLDVNEEGRWRHVDSMSIGETTTEMQMNITEEAPTQTEQTVIQQMEAVSVGLTETVAEITSITATTMELTDEENGGYYTCTKA